MTDGVRFFRVALIVLGALLLSLGLAEGATAQASVTRAGTAASPAGSRASASSAPKPAVRQTLAQRRGMVGTDMSAAHVQAMAPQLLKRREALEIRQSARGARIAKGKPAASAVAGAAQAAASIVPEVGLVSVWGPGGDVMGECFDVNCGPAWSGDTYTGESLSVMAAVLTEPQGGRGMRYCGRLRGGVPRSRLRRIRLRCQGLQQ